MKLKKIVTCIGVIAITHLSLVAREFRLPIPLLKYIYHLEPLAPSEETRTCNAWAGYYQRKCDSAYNVQSTDTHTSPLAALIFNQANFPLNEAFGTQNTPPINILFSTIFSPRVKYTDRGAVFGLVSSHAINCNVVVGGRLTIPYRDFEMRLTQGPIVNNTLNPALLNAVVREQVENIPGVPVPVETFAYRLDFLSTLPAAWTGPDINVKFVNYANPQFRNDITMGNIDVTDNPQFSAKNRNSVFVVEREDGSAPPPPFGAPLTKVQGFPNLPADGEGLLDNEAAKFHHPTNYTPLGNNVAQQAQLWVEPSLTPAGVPVNNALIIENAVDALISSPATPINEILTAAGITFDSQKRKGVGDIDAQFFSQYWWNTCSFVEGNIAVRIPSARRQMNPGLILLESVGNNGHAELMLGGRGYYHDFNWFLLQADALYSWVFKRSENVAAPFQGATVKNIGPSVPADIHWGYFVGHLEAAAYPRYNDRNYAVLRVGYEAYVKTKDHISLETNTVSQFVPNLPPLDPSAAVLKANTHVTAHSLYSEAIFRHDFDHVTAGIFASVGGVVGGKNTPKEVNWYVGLEFTA